LNEKFDVQTAIPDDVANPITQYFCVGLNYEGLINDDNINMDNVRHDPSHGSLFIHAPLIARKVTDGFTEEEYGKYRLRMSATVDGVQYYFMMLKKIDTVFTSGSILKVTTEDGESDVEIFSTLEADILNPIPKSRDDVLDSKIEYLKYSNTLQTVLTAEEQDELKKATNLLYGNEEDDDVDLKELALVSGVDLDYDGRKEAFNTQIAYFEKIDYLLDDNDLNEPFRHTMEIGGMSPMVFRTYNDA
jgi:hypothetical protein